MRSMLLTILLVIAALPAHWETLPPTPAPIPAEHSGHVNANGISIYYAMYGKGSPVILLQAVW